MCPQKQDRTLKTDYSDKIYDIFEKNEICNLVSEKDFLEFLCSIEEFHESAQKEDDRFLQFVDRVHEFILAFEWQKISQVAYGKILPMLKKDGILDDVGDRPQVSLHQTLYHFGMLGFDYKKSNS